MVFPFLSGPPLSSCRFILVLNGPHLNFRVISNGFRRCIITGCSVVAFSYLLNHTTNCTRIPGGSNLYNFSFRITRGVQSLRLVIAGRAAGCTILNGILSVTVRQMRCSKRNGLNTVTILCGLLLCTLDN